MQSFKSWTLSFTTSSVAWNMMCFVIICLWVLWVCSSSLYCIAGSLWGLWALSVWNMRSVQLWRSNAMPMKLPVIQLMTKQQQHPFFDLYREWECFCVYKFSKICVYIFVSMYVSLQSWVCYFLELVFKLNKLLYVFGFYLIFHICCKIWKTPNIKKTTWIWSKKRIQYKFFNEQNRSN